MPRRPAKAIPKPRHPTIYAVDPGVTTGLAVYYAGHIELSQVKLPDIPRFQGFFLRTTPDVLVIEDFQSNPAKNLGGRASIDPIFAPVRVAAVLEAYAERHAHPIQVVYQLPSDKAMMDDKRLALVHPVEFKATRGLPHARDALRHLIVYLRRNPARPQ